MILRVKYSYFEIFTVHEFIVGFLETWAWAACGNILKYLREQWSMANMDFFFQIFHWQGKLKPLKQILIFTILRNLQRSWVVMSWQVQGLWRWDNVTWHKLEIFVISCWKLLASVLFMCIQTLAFFPNHRLI